MKRIANRIRMNNLLCELYNGLRIRKVKTRDTFRRYLLASSVLKEVVNGIFRQMFLFV